MRIKATNARKRRGKNLKVATDEGNKSTSFDAAADYYLKMCRGTAAVPTGRLQELMQLATQQGSVTPEEIADVFDTGELPIEAETSWSVGNV